MTPFIVTLTGPSCAGKSTLERRLRNEGFENLISTTTRTPRSGERNGESYYFMSRKEFMDMEEQGGFVERVEFNGEFYGVSAAEIKRVAALGKPIVVVVEPEGLHQMQSYGFNHGWSIVSVFVDNPPQVIAARFLDRFATDLTLASATGKTQATIDTYAKRLGNLMGNELYWAETHAPVCHIWLRHFDESNIEDVVGVLKERVPDSLW